MACPLDVDESRAHGSDVPVEECPEHVAPVTSDRSSANKNFSAPSLTKSIEIYARPTQLEDVCNDVVGRLVQVFANAVPATHEPGFADPAATVSPEVECRSSDPEAMPPDKAPLSDLDASLVPSPFTISAFR